MKKTLLVNDFVLDTKAPMKFINELRKLCKKHCMKGGTWYYNYEVE